MRVLDGGASQVGLESTIIDLSRPQPVLLRPGSVSLADLQRVLGEPVGWYHAVALAMVAISELAYRATVGTLGRLAPAVLAMGRHFGLFEPARAMRTQGWRRIGTAIVRWPGPVLVATLAVVTGGAGARKLT
mgnify:CR=1 FL=1